MNLWPLLGGPLVVEGWPLALGRGVGVSLAGIPACLGPGGWGVRILALCGEAFIKNRFLMLFVLTLPVIGLLERRGLREFAQGAVQRLRSPSPGRLLMVYQFLRQATSALGLTSLGGHPQTVRPLVAPMAEAAGEKVAGTLDTEGRQRLHAMAAATDNVALFFGEDLFLAFGAVLLIQGVLKDHGILREPLHIALWGLPTAFCAFGLHAWRLHRLDIRLKGLKGERP